MTPSLEPARSTQARRLMLEVRRCILQSHWNYQYEGILHSECCLYRTDWINLITVSIQSPENNCWEPPVWLVPKIKLDYQTILLWEGSIYGACKAITAQRFNFYVLLIWQGGPFVSLRWYYNKNSFVSDVLVLIRFVLSVCQVSFASLAKYLENWLSKNDPDLFSFPVLPNIGARV